MKYTLDLSQYNAKMKILGRMDKQYSIAFDNAIAEITQRLQVKLLERLGAYGLSGSSIGGSIRIIPIGNKGISIRAGAKYASFVEFGTGIVGEGSPHPRAWREGWEYDVEGHGDKGWWYPTVEDDPNPTAYMSSDGDWYAWTKGSASRPFMYETWLYGTRIAYSITQKHIRRVGL